MAEPCVVTRPEQPYVGIRDAVTMETIGRVADRIGELVGWLAGRGAAPAGAPFLRYWVIDMERRLDVEAGVPISEPLDGAGDVTVGTLPAGRYATVTHHGHPDELIGATAALLAWAQELGLTWDAADDPEGIAWACRLEVFLTNPMAQPDLSQWDTELVFKLAD
jgi:effector-binding domain-containing protein